MSADEAMNMHKKVHALQSKLSCAAKQSLSRRFGAHSLRMHPNLSEAEVRRSVARL
jgi:hypothetical protein